MTLWQRVRQRLWLTLPPGWLTLPVCKKCGYAHTDDCWTDPCPRCGMIHTGDWRCS